MIVWKTGKNHGTSGFKKLRNHSQSQKLQERGRGKENTEKNLEKEGDMINMRSLFKIILRMREYFS